MVGSRVSLGPLRAYWRAHRRHATQWGPIGAMQSHIRGRRARAVSARVHHHFFHAPLRLESSTAPHSVAFVSRRPVGALTPGAPRRPPCESRLAPAPRPARRVPRSPRACDRPALFAMRVPLIGTTRLVSCTSVPRSVRFRQLQGVPTPRLCSPRSTRRDPSPEAARPPSCDSDSPHPPPHAQRTPH